MPSHASYNNISYMPFTVASAYFVIKYSFKKSIPPLAYKCKVAHNYQSQCQWVSPKQN